jgi:hypothetical protein
MSGTIVSRKDSPEVGGTYLIVGFWCSLEEAGVSTSKNKV